MRACSMARTKVLMRLREQGPHPAERGWRPISGWSPHSITDIVDALERLGLAERRPDATGPPGPKARRHHRRGARAPWT